MTATDILLIAALTVFVVAWWVRGLRWRPQVLAGSASAALAAGAVGVWDDRWQDGVGVAVSVVFLLALAVATFWKWKTPRWRTPFVSGTLLTLLAALAVAAIYLFPVGRLPAPSGQHAVGVRSFELSDASRLGVFDAGDDEPRRLLVRVWYPAEPEAGAQPRPYFSDAEAAYTARSMGGLLGFGPMLTYLKHASTNSYEDAPLVSGAEKLPTIFYSHGYTSFLSQNTVLMEELASHGYVVYSVQHTYDSSATVFPDGSVAPIDPALVDEMRNSPQAQGKTPKSMVQGFTGRTFDDRLEGQMQFARESLDKDERIVAHSAPTWAADQLFVHDRLESGKVPDSVAEIVAACDLERTGEMGMSFGGATAAVVCLLDKRCVAGVNLDGGDFPFLPFNADLPVPFLMVHSDLGNLYRMFGTTPEDGQRSFNDFSYERFEHAGTRDGLYRAQIKDAAHLGLSDFSLFMRRPLRDGLLGSTPAEVLIGAQNDLVRGFFDRYLRGDASAFPGAAYAKYADWVVPYDNLGLREWWLAKPEEERAAIENRIEDLKGEMDWQELQRE